MISLKEYIEHKTVDFCKTLTRAEANVFRIPYPQKTGWLVKYANNRASLSQLENLLIIAKGRNNTASWKTVRAIESILGLPHCVLVPTQKATPTEQELIRLAKRQVKRAKRNLKKEQRQAKSQRKISTTSKVKVRQPTITTVSHVIKNCAVDVTTDAFLSTFEWKALRMQALAHHGPKCQCCGATPSTGAVMNVDHVKPRKFYPHLALSLDNLQILCGDCNHGKGNWDETDWRNK